MWHWLSDAIGVFVVLVLSVWFVIGLGLVYFLAWIWWRVRSEECRECDGTGECAVCNGSGVVTPAACPDCRGKGQCKYCTPKIAA